MNRQQALAFYYDLANTLRANSARALAAEKARLYRESLPELLRDNAHAVAYLQNCQHRDRHKARHEVIASAKALAEFYDSEIYDGPEE